MSAGALALVLCVAARCAGWRIVGGEPASIGEFPFLASLQRLRAGHCCAANLVTGRWLLTAAHCVSGALGGRPREYVVVAGVTNVTAIGSEQGGQRGQPDLFVVHPLVRHGGSFDYDLALVRLEAPLREGALVRRVALARDTVPDRLLYRQPCTVAGWGSTHKVDACRVASCGVGERSWRPLMKVTLPLLDTENCSRVLRRPLRPHVHLCTHAANKDACQGDSGAALICQGVQVGVVSWGKGCASDYPGVYARVDTQMAWLHQVVSDGPRPPPTPALATVCLLAAATRSLP